MEVNNKHVLLLNADGTPVSWLPLSTISWQNAVRLVWLDVVEVLHDYPDWQVHSPSTTLTVPSVIMLRLQVRTIHQWIARDDSPQSYLVFLRDAFFCQYCHKQFARRDLTIDHVVPRVYGGRNSWQNVTTACAPCNSRRGCDSRIRPLHKPYLPTLRQLLANMRQMPLVMPQRCWNLYLKWDEHRIVLATGRDEPSLNSASSEDPQNIFREVS